MPVPTPSTQAATPAPARRRRIPPLEPVSARARWLLGVGFFVLFVAVWAFFTLGGFVSPTFLASPVTMVKEAAAILLEAGVIRKAPEDYAATFDASYVK